MSQLVLFYKLQLNLSVTAEQFTSLSLNFQNTENLKKTLKELTVYEQNILKFLPQCAKCWIFFPHQNKTPKRFFKKS